VLNRLPVFLGKSPCFRVSGEVRLALVTTPIRAILLASAMAATFVGRRANNAVSHGRCLVPWILALVDDGERSGHEQAAQIAITSFADTAEPVLTPARVLLRHDAQLQGLWR
jgi:hypothetical protein